MLQEVSPLGLAPVFENGRFGAKPVSLRVFAAWTPKGWMVMPGGLTRVAADDTVRALSMQSGASSKDAWVISEAPVDNFTLLGQGARTLEVKRHGESAPSRAMDNLFWLGRYAERTEAFVRILRAVTSRLIDDPANALEVARKLLIPFSQASDNPIEEIASEQALGRRAAASGLQPLQFPRPAAAAGAGGADRLVGARPAVARYLAQHPCPDRQGSTCRPRTRRSTPPPRAFIWTDWWRAPRPWRAFRRRT